jgi:biofilm PGA synthesis N-glycosyltransferase PgaC
MSASRNARGNGRNVAGEAAVLIVSPVRNEAAHIERVAAGVAAQELPPARWIVVDDGSEDGTLDILRRLEAQLSYMTVVTSESLSAGAVADRLAHAAAPRAFNAGLAAAGGPGAYSHVMKLDGDIELDPSYLRVLVARFWADPSLGLAGGVLDEPTVGGGRRRIRIPRVHVHGALKCYSRACFEAIGGVRECLGWDTIDETYARMRGFRTWSFPDLVCLHHRPLGSADGTLRGHARHGECAYIAHYPGWWVALRAGKVASRMPRGVSGAAFLYGFSRAWVRRVERVPDPAYRAFTRRELRRRALRLGMAWPPDRLLGRR